MLVGYHLGRCFYFDNPWLSIDGKRYGFLMTSDEGEKFLVVHPFRVGRCNKEYGFYVPFPVLTQLRRDIIFEVRTKKGYTHYILRLSSKQRMFKGPDDVFVSLARLETILDAQHIIRPKIRGPK